MLRVLRGASCLREERSACKPERDDRPALSPLLLFRSQWTDLPGRLGSAVWKCLWEHPPLDVPGCRGVHAGTGRGQLDRRDVGGSSICDPTGIAAPWVRVF